MRVLRWIGIVLAALVAVLAVVAVAARFSDGPLGPFAGGPLLAGELVTEMDVDWSSLEGLGTIELQLEEPPRSRTVWFVLHEGDLYVPCGAPGFTLWKQWPHEAMENGGAILRAMGKRHERQAVRVTDPEIVEPVLARVAEKYGLGDPSAAPYDVWIFRMGPREG